VFNAGKVSSVFRRVVGNTAQANATTPLSLGGREKCIGLARLADPEAIEAFSCAKVAAKKWKCSPHLAANGNTVPMNAMWVLESASHIEDGRKSKLGIVSYVGRSLKSAELDDHHAGSNYVQMPARD